MPPPPRCTLFPYTTLFRSDDVLSEVSHDIRFHLSRGAAESFVNTAALLHPRGYLQVQDTFRSEEHTSELQSRLHPACPPLPGKKNGVSRPHFQAAITSAAR